MNAVGSAPRSGLRVDFDVYAPPSVAAVVSVSLVGVSCARRQLSIAKLDGTLTSVRNRRVWDCTALGRSEIASARNLGSVGGWRAELHGTCESIREANEATARYFRGPSPRRP